MNYPNFITTDNDKQRWDELTDAERAEYIDYAEYLVNAGYDAPTSLADIDTARLAGA